MENGTFTSNEDVPYAVVLELVPSDLHPPTPESWSFYSFVLLIQGQGSQTKGQLISKCPYEITVSSNIPTRLFLDFCLEIFVASWGLPGRFLGFLGT